MHELTPERPLLFFGCGNMGRAMLDGWLRSGKAATCFTVVDPAAADYPQGVRHLVDCNGIEIKFDKVVIAVKPQMFDTVVPLLSAVLDDRALVLSVMAGVRTDRLDESVPGRTVVRLMPNLAAALGRSPLGLCAGGNRAIDRSAIDALVAPLGTPIWIEDENLMDAVTALAGSGPAFVYRFIDALAQAGKDLGLSPDVASRLAMAMVDGSVDLAATAAVSPKELAARVTSPGGTTAAGLAVLDRDEALNSLIRETLRAARDRGAELA